MIELIETNLAIDENKDIRDHQSRVVLADDWESYCEAYERYDGSRVTFPSKNPFHRLPLQSGVKCWI